MTNHVFDEFPLLLSGDADRATVARVSSHLRGCNDCKDELIGAVVAHATLSSAARRGPDVATGGRLPHRPRVPGVQLASATLADRLDEVVVTATGPESAHGIDLGPVFAQIREEVATAAGPPPADADLVTPTAEAPASRDDARRRHRLRRGLTAAAAAVVVLGGGSALVANQLQDNGHRVTVGAFGQGTVGATATVDTGSIVLNASKLRPLPGNQFYEVWLVKANGSGVLPLGPLGSDRTGRYTVPSSVMSTYQAVQVTVQDNNGSPLPSKTSVLRGNYQA